MKTDKESIVQYGTCIELLYKSHVIYLIKILIAHRDVIMLLNFELPFKNINIITWHITFM